jgi:hypothetical protein
MPRRHLQTGETGELFIGLWMYGWFDSVGNPASENITDVVFPGTIILIEGHYDSRKS